MEKKLIGKTSFFYCKRLLELGFSFFLLCSCFLSRFFIWDDPERTPCYINWIAHWYCKKVTYKVEKKNRKSARKKERKKHVQVQFDFMYISHVGSNLYPIITFKKITTMLNPIRGTAN
jgi:hypothetical protein